MNVSDKETRAVFLNFKELRGLEKNVQALDIEQAYSISLINLDQKLMKVNYKKLKDKVSRIRSHLNNGVIEDLKKLENEGKLQFEKSASKVDFNIRIEAAAKRLKLQNRAKSAAPRLQSQNGNHSRAGSSAHFIQTPRKHNHLTPAASSPAPRVGEFSSRRKSPGRSPQIVIDEVPDVDFPVPRSVRTERRKSIDIKCTMDDEPTDKNVIDALSLIQDGIKSRTGSFSSFHSLETGNAMAGRRPSSLNSPSAIKVRTNSSETLAKTNDTSEVNERPRTGSMSSNRPESRTVKATHISFEGNNLLSPADALTPPSVDNNKLRPMSVPASKVTPTDAGSKQKRPVTAAQLAVAARKKSVADIQRVSRLLAEGKTRVPFSSHDLKAMEMKSKVAKPFRSIREGTFSVGIDRDVVDNTLGDDLHKEMKKGLILGEVATNLVLEDRIDHFLERVDQYVKENPNYTFDAERTKAELKAIRDANKAQKKKKPRRNKLRRRQLQRQLQEENAMAEAAKSRYLRLSDDKLDLSSVNTLAIDQMRMLKHLRCFDDSD